MARAVYQHELQDQDFSWLVQRFQEAHPEYVLVESAALPVVLFRGDSSVSTASDMPMVLGEEQDEETSIPEDAGPYTPDRES